MTLPTTVIGSFPRPTELVELYYRKSTGAFVDEQRFAELIENAMHKHVQLQVRCGVDIVSSGEASRPNFVTYVTQRLTGFDGEQTLWEMRDTDLFPEASYAYYRAHAKGFEINRTPRLTRPVQYAGPELIRSEIALFTHALASYGRTPASAFLSVVAPDSVAHAIEQQGVYEEEEEYLAALADALRSECQEIIAAGFLLQIDAPGLLMDFSHKRHEGKDMQAYRDHVQRCVGMIHRMTEGIPPERLRVHACWGNHIGPHSTDIPLHEVLDLLLQLPGDGLCLEACSPGHRSDFLAFQSYVPLPPQKLIYLGVVDPKTPQLESVDAIRYQLREAETVLGAGHAGASPNCGFETYAGISYLDEQIIGEKLTRMVNATHSAKTYLLNKREEDDYHHS